MWHELTVQPGGELRQLLGECQLSPPSTQRASAGRCAARAAGRGRDAAGQSHIILEMKRPGDSVPPGGFEHTASRLSG
jgi:hypothetical protein